MACAVALDKQGRHQFGRRLKRLRAIVLPLQLDQTGIHLDVDSDDYGRTPLLWVVRNVNERTGGLLLHKSEVDFEFKVEIHLRLLRP